MRTRACIRVLIGVALAGLAACASPPRGPAPIERPGMGGPSSAGPRCERVITVQRGDTLSGIAAQCGVSLQDLAQENRLSAPYAINPGQRLQVPGPATYTVRRGDNLYRIALAHGMSTDDLAALNRLSRPYTIYPGQELRVRGTARTTLAQAPAQRPSAGGARTDTPARVTNDAPPPPAGGPQFAWPLSGDIISRFGDTGAGRLDGIRIRARMGEPVRAAASGEVVYAGNELQGYGELVLIRHADRWVTAYGLNSTLRVSVGQQVAAGDHIADAGASGALDEPALHFEIRRGVTPVDPLQRLPAR